MHIDHKSRKKVNILLTYGNKYSIHLYAKNKLYINQLKSIVCVD